MRPKTQITHTDYMSLIYKIFHTDDGKMLLDIWTDQFIFRKVAQDGDDLLSIGLKQGEVQFVLSIHNLINDTKNQGQ